MKIVLVGCGFLGSWWAEFAAKRLYAAEREAEFVTVDKDEWEPRNAANQNIRPMHMTIDGKEPNPKACTIADLMQHYGFKAKWLQANILTDWSAWAREGDLLVDALDNLAAHREVWEQGMRTGTPILHMGINDKQSGVVEWTIPGSLQGWHLNPITAHLPAETEEVEQPKHPPCHLVQTVPLGINVAWAGAVALTLAMQEDIEERFELGPQLPYRIYTQWTATPHSIEIDKENLYVEERKGKEEGKAVAIESGN